MQQIRLGNSELYASRLGYGCMRIVGDGSVGDRRKGKRAINAAVDAGYTLFDHADIYADGACEELFGEFLKESPALREKIIIAGKCGIRFPGRPTDRDPARYDFSAKHLRDSVDGSLRRLAIDYLDLLLLHRPDYLMDVQEVASTFDALRSSGKVANFGVSNFSVSQVALLQSALSEPLLVNQLEINLHNIDAFDNGTLDQCRQLGMTPQAWCPVAGVVYQAWGNRFSEEDAARIEKEVGRQAAQYGTEPAQIGLAWLLRHPAGISPIVGSSTPERIAAATTALDINYSREDWYRLLEARNGRPVP